ncbi:positive regulator of sigma E activity [Mycoplana sp. BE70]|nr:positive regulator of sigma E activity [Mycoplana sp. BE70]
MTNSQCGRCQRKYICLSRKDSKLVCGSRPWRVTIILELDAGELDTE